MKKMIVKVAIVCALLLLICLGVRSFQGYADRQNCVCSVLTEQEQTLAIDDRLYRVCEKNTMSSGTFMYVRTVCDHGKRLHLTVFPDEGMYQGYIITE